MKFPLRSPADGARNLLSLLCFHNTFGSLSEPFVAFRSQYRAAQPPRPKFGDRMLRGDTEQRHPSPPCGKTAWGGFRVSELSCIQKALWRNWRGRNAPQLHVAASETCELCHTLHGGTRRGDSLLDGACRVSSRASLCPQPHVSVERQTFGGGMKARPRH